MQFLNPSILFGLLAASIPLILHLINLRRNRQVEFSSNRFLEELKKSNIRNIKIKNLLLLILRMLIIGSLVFAFSRPVIEGSVPMMDKQQPSSNVIILDNSFSMEIPTAEGQALSHAKSKAAEILSNLPDQSELSILTATPGGDNRLINDRLLLMERITETKLSYSKLDLSELNDRIAGVFSDAAYTYRNIFLVTDNQEENGYIETDYPVYIYDLSESVSEEITNLSVDSCTVAQEILIPGGEIEVSVYVRNSGNTDIEQSELLLMSGDQIYGKTNIDLEAGKSTIKTFNVKVPGNGVLDLTAKLSDDLVSSDNRYHIALATPPIPKIGIIGSGSSLFYLDKLFGGMNSGSGQEQHVLLSENDIKTTDLNQFGLLILASGNYSKNSLDVLSNAVRNNIPAMIFAPLNTSKEFEGFLGSLGFDGFRWKQLGDEPLRIAIDDSHPAVEGIFSEDYGNIDAIAAQKLLELNGSNAYIRAGASPLFTEGRGFGNDIRVLFVGVSSDLTYSDFPLLKSFAPFVFKSSLYLTGVKPELTMFESGELVELELNGEEDIVRVEYPGGTSYENAIVRIGGSAFLDMGRLEETGNYVVRDTKEKVLRVFSVNHDPSESDFNYADTYPEGYIKIDKDIPLKDYLTGSAAQTEIWQLFVILAILLAIIESWVGSSATKS